MFSPDRMVFDCLMPVLTHVSQIFLCRWLTKLLFYGTFRYQYRLTLAISCSKQGDFLPWQIYWSASFSEREAFSQLQVYQAWKETGYQPEGVQESQNWFEAIVNKLGGEESAERFLRGELVVLEDTVKRWREVDGIIYLTVTLDKPTSGEGWIYRTEEKGNRVRTYAKSVLRSKKFTSSTAGTYEIVILKGSLFEDNDRMTSNIRAKADGMGLVKPNADIACLIREQFSDKEIEAMGLWWIVAMHEPIKDSDGDPSLLSAHRVVDGRWLHACRGYPGRRWDREDGFAFLVPQVSQHSVL